MSIAMIGLDTAKTTFQVHGVDETEKVEIKRKLRRNEVVGFFATQPACTVVLEACAAAHHWGRVLETLGHTVKLVAPKAVRVSVLEGGGNSQRRLVWHGGVGGGGHRISRLRWSCETATRAERGTDGRREIAAIRVAGEGW